MTKKIVYTKPGGGVFIVHPASKDDLMVVPMFIEIYGDENGGVSDENYETHVWTRSIPEDAINAHYISDENIPQDYYFRDAWAHNFTDKKIEVDMPKAQEIHMTRIREARDRALEILDIETMKGNDVQAQKQALRDIPQNFDLKGAKTPEELKALWPEELKEKNNG